MKTYEFQDIDGQNVRVYLSKDGTDTGHLHLTHNQSVILISAISELVEDAE